jgi:hypothetical protein
MTGNRNGPLTRPDENAIFNAIVECGREVAARTENCTEEGGIYKFLSETPLLVLTVTLRCKMEAKGYTITHTGEKNGKAKKV